MKKVEVIEVKKLGRPVNENSVRQQRLKELESKRKNGELKLGRPIKEDSERQKRWWIELWVPWNMKVRGMKGVISPGWRMITGLVMRTSGLNKQFVY